MQAKKPFDKNSLIERDQIIKARLDELREFTGDEGESLNEVSIANILSLMNENNSFIKNRLIERDALIKARLDELREFAADEGESLNEGSIADFLSLMNENESFLAPYIFSNYEGEISITWHNEKRLSVVFFGNKITELTFYEEVSKIFVSLPVIYKLHISQTRDFIKSKDFCLFYMPEEKPLEQVEFNRKTKMKQQIQSLVA